MKESLKIFKALCDETRLKIVEFLLNGEKCVCEIAPFTKRTQPTVSIQLAKLQHLGIVESRREGKSVYYKLANPKLKQLLTTAEHDTGALVADEIRYSPIGLVRSPFKQAIGTPIQPAAAKGVNGTVRLFPEYVEGLKDLEGFSHIILIYHFHLSKQSSLREKPYMDDQAHGVFATRSPSRPNPIGLSVVRLIKVRNDTLHIRNVDILDKTPLLDIKPYVPQFDAGGAVKLGWIKDRLHELPRSKDDGRFAKSERGGKR